MNWKISGMNGMIKFLLFLLLSITSFLFAEEMNVYTELNRFPTSEGFTRFDFVYKITYNNLTFLPKQDSFEAFLDVSIKIMKENSLVKEVNFSTPFNEVNKDVTLSQYEYMMDKISLTFSTQGYSIIIEFSDRHSGNNKIWEQDFELLSQKFSISDLEFSSEVIEVDAEIKNKFLRGNNLFYVNPSHIFDPDETENLFIYFEAGVVDSSSVSGYIADLKIDCENDIVSEDSFVLSELASDKILAKIIPYSISKLKDGFFNVTLSIKNDNEIIAEQYGYFIIKKQRSKSTRLFVDLEDEYEIIKYFWPTSKTRVWRKLSEEGKNQFVEKFWQSTDINPTTEENEFIDAIRIKVDYANQHFSSFEPGWKNDMGRIYIKYGLPDEIKEYRTSSYSRYPDKEYKVWRYYSNTYRVYMFLDIASNGNYRLLYSKNDDKESTNPNWKMYFESDFDESVLE
ncbi:MAG: GWxTD domain-containing protein [Candidatus Cloacimonetes bacterium]|nr:GWxTD domain-containing protein [Candidatus Cloacimonadota bacterium]